MGFDHLLAVQVGGYVSTVKAIPVVVILLLWARLLTWADKDAIVAHLPRIQMNMANMGGLVLAFGLFFYLPTFILSFAVLLVIACAEAGVYLHLRNKEVGLGDLERQFKAWIAGMKGKEAVKAEAGKVSITGKDNKLLPVPVAESLDRPAYDAVQQSLTDPLIKNAQQIDLAPEGDGMLVKYVVDNYPYKGPILDKTIGAAAIGYLKWAAGMNIEDRRKPQTGTLKVALDKDRHELRMQTAGTTAGEYLRVVVDPKMRHSYAFDTLGFTDAQKTLLLDTIKANTGIVLVSAPKGHGLTSLFYAILRTHDAFLQHIQTIERDQEQDLEGITQNKLATGATGAEELKLVDWTISQQPDVVGMSSVEDAKTAASLIDFAKDGKRVYVCMRANSTSEAIEKWRRLVGDSKRATESLKLVINERVLRRLCLACKEGFTPDPSTLKKFNMSPDKVTTLYKAREQTLRDKKGQPVPCQFCLELRYKGRMGVFELMVVDDEIRAALDSNRPLAQAFRKQRGRLLQEELLTLVEKGETSVQEVQRVIKGGTDAVPGVAGPAPAAAPGARPAAPAAKPARAARPQASA
ncbi:MAG TPA: ATPase, T2SS/T4P/T4SS family [Tepidisphaeraceae bacterium]|nr:ATPase, T2SS/T4P/T4SS family [Tepidisphaeraceae bacterium]